MVERNLPKVAGSSPVFTLFLIVMKQTLLLLMFLCLATVRGQYTSGEYKLSLSQYGLKGKVTLRTIEFEEISKEERR